MKYTLEEALNYIKEEDVKFIRLAFRDAFGIQKNISVLSGELRKAVEFGSPINARAIAGFEDSPHPYLYLRPDLSTMAILPWRPDSGRVLRVFCDVYTPEGKEYESDTRRILKKAVEEAEAEGVEFRFGSEMEFYLFRTDEDGNPTKIPYDSAGYMDIAPLDKCENIRREIILTIERMGLVPERSHHEAGPGQNEIDFHYGRPLKAADQMSTFKMVVSTIAGLYGLTADFSPMPLKDQPGNGYHINIYAQDQDGQDKVMYAAAGIMERIRDMTLFLNPSDNSYERFGTGSAPDRVNWSGAGTSGLMYIESRNGRTRAELRSPDASGNPYLIYTLLIHAGLDGIRKRLTLTERAEKECPLLPASKKEAAMIAGESDFIKRVIPGGILLKYTT